MTHTQEDLAKMEDAGLFAQGNAATLIMSRTGQGKSSLIATLARFVKREYNKKTLVYMFDGGGFPMEVQSLVLSGVIGLFRARTRDPYNQGLMWDTVIKSAQGFWPTSISPRRGEVPPGVAMMPPVVTEFQVLCPNGHEFVRTTNSQGVRDGMCPTCRVAVSAVNWQVKTVTTRPKFFEDVGAVAYDSLTQLLNWGEEDLAQRSGRGDLQGMDGAIGGKVISGDQKLGQTTMSHIGFTQQQARSIVLMTNGIPGLVVPPVFTALTLEATAEGMRIMGPELSGKKKTAGAGAWFGNVLEPEKKEVGRDGGGRQTFQYVLHLEEWVDNDGVKHLCKNRAAPGLLPPFYADPPLTNTPEDEKTAFTEFSLGKFFTALAGALSTKTDAALKEFGTDLVPDVMQSYEAPQSAVPGAPAPGSGPAAFGAPAGMSFAPPPGVAAIGGAGGFTPSGPAPFATVGSAATVTSPFAAPAAPQASPTPPSSIGGPAAPVAAPVPAQPMQAPVLQQPTLVAPGSLTPGAPLALSPPATQPAAPVAAPRAPATATAATPLASPPFAPAAPFAQGGPPPNLAGSPAAPSGAVSFPVGPKPPQGPVPHIAPPAGRQAPGVTQL